MGALNVAIILELQRGILRQQQASSILQARIIHWHHRLNTTDTMDRGKQERLRRHFRPAKLRLLFVGESPPASGRFFYQGDSGLYRAMRDAFQATDPSITDANFLSRFKASGCYLMDLCPEPVDQLDAKARRAACVASEASLTRTIAKLHPPVIATVVRSIEINVRRAANGADWQGKFLHLPYPGRWASHRDVFIRRLVAELGSA